MQSQYKRNRFYKPEVFSIELNKIIITYCRNFHHMIFPALMYVRILMYIWLYVINYRSHLFQEAVASFQSRKLCLCRRRISFKTINDIEFASNQHGIKEYLDISCWCATQHFPIMLSIGLRISYFKLLLHSLN